MNTSTNTPITIHLPFIPTEYGLICLCADFGFCEHCPVTSTNPEAEYKP